MNAKAEASRLTIEYALLGVLHERPMHGYDLFRRMRDNSGLGMIWHVKQSNLYGLLTKLRQRGLVAADRLEQTNRPARKVFRLTAAGRRTFDEWLREPVAHGRSVRMEFLAKLYFAREAGQNVGRELVARQREVCAAWLARYEERCTALDEASDFDRIVYQFRIGQLRSMLVWLDSCTSFLGAN